MSSNPLSLDYCQECHFVFRTLEACPRTDIISTASSGIIFLQYLFFVSSFLPVFIYLSILVASIIKKNTRGFYILANILIQQVITAVLKMYIAQKRPEGACSSSFGYPSGHSGFATAMTTWLILEVLCFDPYAEFKQSRFYRWSRNAFLVFAPWIPISRHFLNYHTPEQIIVGCLVGNITTILFFMLAFGSSCKNYEAIVEKVMSRYRMRDAYVHQSDACSNYAKEQPEVEQV